MIDLKEYRIKSLQNQVEFIAVARARHFLWATDSRDAETSKIHTEIGNLVAQTLRQYDRLMAKYLQPPDVGTAE